MGSPRSKSKRSAFGPFIIGIVIGLVLSIGLRYLSKSNSCWRRGLPYDTSVPSSILNPKTQENHFLNAITKTDDENAAWNRNEPYDSQNRKQQQLLMDSYDEKVIMPSNKVPLQPQQQDQLESLDELLPGNFALKGQEEDSDNTNALSSSSTSTKIPSKKNPLWKTRQNNLLLVGVMTAQKYLNNRVIGVFETWAQQIPGRVIFFTGANSTGNSNYNNYKKFKNNFTMVALEGVDDSYPPQKKSFRMIKYMYDNFRDDYEWFMRADDDVYVKAEKLSEFLRSINSRQLYFIGQAGKGNDAEKGTLNLAHNENFCMGGPGIIFSRVALAKVAPFVNECLQEMYSTHEDVEIGRCVQRFAGISCTWAYEMQSIFYHNSSGDEAFTENLKRREVHRAITLHPVKDYRHMYRLHAYVQSLKVQQLFYESLLVQRELLALPPENSSFDLNLGSDGFSASWKENRTTKAVTKVLEDIAIYGLPPSLNKFLPKNESEIIPWTFLSSSGTYSQKSLSPKMKIESSLKEAIEDVVREMMDLINGYSKTRGRVIDFKEILYGYHRINPLHGQDFILDLLMTYKKYRGKKMTVPVRRHAYIQRAFSPLQLRFIPNHVQERSSEEQQSIAPKFVMILPLSGRLEAFERFLESYGENCDAWHVEIEQKIGLPKYFYALNLIIVYYGSSDGDKEESRGRFYSLVNSFRSQRLLNAQNSVKTSHCTIEVVQSSDEEFSRSIALETGISQSNENDLLFLIDVDIRFSIEALRRVLLNTVQGKQVYFPVVFSQYNPNFLSGNPNRHSSWEDTEISGDRGYWRSYGYGIAAFYKSDYRLAGGFDTTIKGWGKEDVSLYSRFITNTTLTIFRAPDPQLIHIYHQFHCDPETLSRPQYTMCLGSQANSLGSSKNLMKFIFQHRPGPQGHIKRFMDLAPATLSSNSA